MKNITATDFYDYTKCKYCVFLNKNGNLGLRDKTSDFVRLLWDRGVQHEDKVIEYIKNNDKRKRFAEVSKDKPADKETFLETVELMKRGIDYIYQGVMVAGNLVGRPDLLEKIVGKSKLGNYYYIPVDIKAGRGYEGDDASEGKVKESYLFQLDFYNLLLSKIQNFAPEFGKIININQEELRYETNFNEDKFSRIMEEITLMVRGGELYQPTIGGKCGLCRWQTYCNNWAKKKRDLSLLFYVGENKYSLQEYGIKQIKELLIKPLESWLKELPAIKKQGRLKGFAEKSFTNVYKRAQAYEKGKEVFYSRAKFPESQKEIHFDIEDDPTQDITYLFGFYIMDLSRGQNYYEYLMTDKIDGEKEIVEKLWNFLKKNKNVPFYHYSSHEISTLRRLQNKYDLEKSVLENFERNAVDLYEIIKACSDWPLTSYGLKSICKFTGFKWSADDAGGANSIEWFSRLLDGEKEMAEKILKYNEEDCKATAHLKEYILKNSLNSKYIEAKNKKKV
jgi:uncharacterized protein